MATMTAVSAAAVYEIQKVRDNAYAALDGPDEPDPAVLAAAERADAQCRAARAEIGGRVYRVPVENVAGLAKRVAKINRRAAKLGVEPVRYVETEETWDLERKEDGKVVAVVEHVFVVVGAQVVKMAGWQFAATIEHDDEGNIVRQVPGVEADLKAYRTAAPWCFHCKTVRNRVDTFVVLHEDGSTEQVGRNCLVDFLGADAKFAAQQAEWLCDLEDACEAAEGGGDGGARGVAAVELEEFLTHVALSIRTGTWRSRGAAREYGGGATADSAIANLCECQKALYREPGPKDRHELPVEEDRAAAVKAIAWARETWCAMDIDERNDFEHNMAVAVAKDFVPVRRIGLAAYAVQGYRKAFEETIRAEAVAKADAEAEFVGEVGKRDTFTVTVTRIVEIADRYSYDGGTKPLYLMVDEAGNPLKWFASGWSAEMEQGETYTLKATVKAHEADAKFGKATMLTRCKVIA